MCCSFRPDQSIDKYHKNYCIQCIYIQLYSCGIKGNTLGWTQDFLNPTDSHASFIDQFLPLKIVKYCKNNVQNKWKMCFNPKT